MGGGNAESIVLFDGVCNLCERTVQLIIKNDEARRFRFAALQSAPAQDIVTKFGVDAEPLSSVLLIEDGQLYEKSRAALRIARNMDGAWPLMFYAFYWLPRWLADPIYDFVGDRRYRWFGKKESCWIPDQRTTGRFIDEKTPAANQRTGDGARDRAEG